MPEMHLKQPGSTYSACGTFTKNKERIKKFMPTGNTDYIYKNNIDQACCQHDMACGKYKDLSKRTESDKVLSNRVFEISSNAKYYGYQRGLTPMVYELFDKKIRWQWCKCYAKSTTFKWTSKTNYWKILKRGVYYLFKDNIWVLI